MWKLILWQQAHQHISVTPKSTLFELQTENLYSIICMMIVETHTHATYHMMKCRADYKLSIWQIPNKKRPINIYAHQLLNEIACEWVRIWAQSMCVCIYVWVCATEFFTLIFRFRASEFQMIAFVCAAAYRSKTCPLYYSINWMW